MIRQGIAAAVVTAMLTWAAAAGRAQQAGDPPAPLGPPLPHKPEPLGPPVPEKLTREPSSSSPQQSYSLAPTTAAALPLADGEDNFDEDRPKTESGLVEYLATRFSAHEPIYFLGGAVTPSVKFQISLKYQLLSPEGSIAQALPWASNFYLAYSQTSFWDIGGESNPFFDSSYRPAALYEQTWLGVHWLPAMSRFDVQAGLQHESNGKGGGDSRTINIAYVRPVFTFGDSGSGRGFFVAVAPRVWAYVFSLRDNPDIADYRGYGDLTLITGWRGSLQLAAMGRMGNDWDKGALQLDLTYPLRQITAKNLDLYLDAQFFTGYGESLLEYNESTTTFRIGVSLVR